MMASKAKIKKALPYQNRIRSMPPKQRQGVGGYYLTDEDLLVLGKITPCFYSSSKRLK